MAEMAKTAFQIAASFLGLPLGFYCFWQSLNWTLVLLCINWPVNSWLAEMVFQMTMLAHIVLAMVVCMKVASAIVGR